MTPIVEIENDEYDIISINKETNMISKTLFDVKFDELRNNYIIEDDSSVYEFIQKNENLFMMLEEVKSSLKTHFNN